MITMAAMLLAGSACSGLPANSSTPTSTATSNLQPQLQVIDTATPVPLAGTTSTDDPNNPVKQGSSKICELITQPEAEAVLNQAVVSITPGADTDDISGKPVSFCNYLGTGLTVLVTLVDMGTPQAAEDELNAVVAGAKADNATTVSKQSDELGEHSYWFTSQHAVGFYGTKGQYVFSLTLGGNIGDAESHKAALLFLVTTLASRI